MHLFYTIMNYFFLTMVLPFGGNLTVTCSVFIRALCARWHTVILLPCYVCASPVLTTLLPVLTGTFSDQGGFCNSALVCSACTLLYSTPCWHSTGGVKQPAFSSPTFSRGNDILSDLLLLNWVLMKRQCCTPLCKEHMWLQVINYSLEESETLMFKILYGNY